ncbi:MAG: hypothetical protein LBK94_13050 [Prevotellaceae bacterium]|jgi:hypothetical protein|nr:hypothetical protein [Prevotellaceae bacterium]
MKINLYTDGNKFSSVCNFTWIRTEIYPDTDVILLARVFHNALPVYLLIYTV